MGWLKQLIMRYISNNMVSIRYKSGGHSFSEEALREALTDGHDVELCVITPKTVLVPRDCYIYTECCDYLSAVGLAPSPSEIVVDAFGDDAMVAVMAVDRAFVERINAAGSRIFFTSPLLAKPIERGTVIELVEDVAYIRVYDVMLRFAEAVAVQSDADLLFVLEKLNATYGIYNMYARAYGDVERVARISKGLFKNLER